MSAHLQVLEEEGLIKVSRVPTVKGPRVVISITDKGKDVVIQYFQFVEELRRLGIELSEK